MENQRYGGEEQSGNDLGVGVSVERSINLTDQAEPEALLHIARLLGLRQDESGMLR